MGYNYWWTLLTLNLPKFITFCTSTILYFKFTLCQLKMITHLIFGKWYAKNFRNMVKILRAIWMQVCNQMLCPISKKNFTVKQVQFSRISWQNAQNKYTTFHNWNEHIVISTQRLDYNTYYTHKVSKYLSLHTIFSKCGRNLQA